MLKVVLFSNMSEVAPLMEPKAFNYIGESQIESFESFDDFNLLAFDWYDIKSEDGIASKIIIYIDEHDLFFFCCHVYSSSVFIVIVICSSTFRLAFFTSACESLLSFSMYF